MNDQPPIQQFILQTISDKNLANRCAELVEYPSSLMGYVMGYMHGLLEGFPEGCKTEAELRIVFNRLCHIEEE